ncbi:MAG: excinuclease ABC subunit UvrA [Candidatus Kryptonium sp.]
MENEKILIKGARVHNLKNIDLELPKNKLIVFTGVSGSGKSSLAFDTIYAEGQRRYVESLSAYARQFLERMDKPDVDLIEGIAPAIAIDQKSTGRNPRSTVGTMTEIYDYLRLLFARVGKTYCSKCGNLVQKDTPGFVVEKIKQLPEGSKIYILFPLHIHKGHTIEDELEALKEKGFYRIFVKDELIDLSEGIDFKKLKKEEIYVLVDRLVVRSDIDEVRLFDSVEMGFNEGRGHLVVKVLDSGEIMKFSEHFECAYCKIEYEEPEPRLFSFNNPYGACPKCQGFGRAYGIDWDALVPDKTKSIKDGAIYPWRSEKFSWFQKDLLRVAKKIGIPIDVPFKDLSPDHIEIIKNGYDGFEGINGFFKLLEENSYKVHYRVMLSRYRRYTTCDLCGGSRLRKEALNVKIEGKTIYDIVRMSIEEAYFFFQNIELTDYEKTISASILSEINRRLKYLYEVGLGYLTLDRLSNTLSGGEAQRINLATALGSSLVGTLYILDEPSIGLHPRDTHRLIKILKSLKENGNTVIVVEHDREVIESADHIVDLGPGAGENGGRVVFQGKYEDLLKDENSLTGKYLSGRLKIPVPKERRKPKRGNSIIVRGAREHNLKNIDVEFPLNVFVCVTGVSGSGKSTLVYDVLYAALKKLKEGSYEGKVGKFDAIEGHELIDAVEMVDQSPIGKTPRSNPVTYVKAFDGIREIFASTYLAKVRGYTPGHFSFNIPGGRCETCEGDGFVKIEMQFLADIYLPCDSCNGKRYKSEILEVEYKGKNISDVLNMTVTEAIEFFKGHKKVVERLKVLDAVGLGYIKLGQPANTLSGGEAQRVKLSAHLLASETSPHTLFIFDEPTTGLHFDDIAKLLKAFNALLDAGHSIIVIEHNMDVIKCADWIIDLGPEAGDRGGYIVAVGTPEEIAKNPNSYTGQFLKKYLNDV